MRPTHYIDVGDMAKSLLGSRVSVKTDAAAKRKARELLKLAPIGCRAWIYRWDSAAEAPASVPVGFL